MNKKKIKRAFSALAKKQKQVMKSLLKTRKKRKKTKKNK